MNRQATFAALLGVSIAAGAWLFMPASLPIEQGGACDSGGACTADGPAETAPHEAAEERVQPPLSEEPPTPVAASPPQRAPAVAAAPAPPIDAIKLREQADQALAAGHYPDAIVALKAATKVDPSARNHGDLGELLAKLLNLDEALIHLRKAADLDPGNADRWITLANAYYRKPDPGKAWAAEKRAKQADPDLVLGFDQSGRRVRKTSTSGDSSAGKP